MSIENINWFMVIGIVVVCFGIGLALTLKRKIINEKDILDMAANMRSSEEAIDYLAKGIVDNTIWEEDELTTTSIEVKKAKGDYRLQEFLNKDALEKTYNAKKLKFGGIGLIIGLIGMGGLLISGRTGGIIYLPLLIPAIGWIMPRFLLSNYTKKIEQEVVDIIPDILGYLSAFTDQEAQIVRPLEMIIENDDENADNILYASIREAIRGVGMGGTFYDSLQDHANRLNIDEWKGVVFTLNQARQVAGRDVLDIIKEVEADFRNDRRLLIEAQAAKVANQLSMISNLMLVPSVYIYTMVPAFMMLGDAGL